MPVARLPSVLLLFDRGTILLRDLDPGFDPSAIPGVLWDPRVQAYRTPAYRHEALRRELTRRGLPFSDDVRLPQPPLGSWSPIELRPYQEAALWAWELAQRRATVVLPTGSGKTRLALAAMARAGSSALCLVPTRILLAQWLHHIGRTYAGPIGCYGDGAHELAALTVATFESAYRHMDRLGNRFDLLVIDEAHHFGCGLRDEALEMSIAAARLGLTATSPRDAAVAERLVELVGPIAYELTIGDLAGSFLSSFRHHHAAPRPDGCRAASVRGLDDDVPDRACAVPARGTRCELGGFRAGGGTDGRRAACAGGLPSCAQAHCLHGGQARDAPRAAPPSFP